MAQGAAVLFQNAAAQRQAQAHAFVFGSEKGGEQALGDFWGDANAGVGHGKFNGLGRMKARLQVQDAWLGAGLHGLQAVAGQVEQ